MPIVVRASQTCKRKPYKNELKHYNLWLTALNKLERPRLLREFVMRTLFLFQISTKEQMKPCGKQR